MVLGLAMQRYGEQLTDEQEVLSWAADILIDTYAADSAVTRATQAARTARRTNMVALIVFEDAMWTPCSAWNTTVTPCMACMAAGMAARRKPITRRDVCTRAPKTTVRSPQPFFADWVNSPDRVASTTFKLPIGLLDLSIRLANDLATSYRHSLAHAIASVVSLSFSLTTTVRRRPLALFTTRTRRVRCRQRPRCTPPSRSNISASHRARNTRRLVGGDCTTLPPKHKPSSWFFVGRRVGLTHSLTHSLTP